MSYSRAVSRGLSRSASASPSRLGTAEAPIELDFDNEFPPLLSPSLVPLTAIDTPVAPVTTAAPVAPVASVSHLRKRRTIQPDTDDTDEEIDIRDFVNISPPRRHIVKRSKLPNNPKVLLQKNQDFDICAPDSRPFVLRDESPEVESTRPPTLINKLKKSKKPLKTTTAPSVLRSSTTSTRVTTPPHPHYRSRYAIRSPSPIAFVDPSRSPSPIASIASFRSSSPVASSRSPSFAAFSQASTAYFTPEASPPEFPSQSSQSSQSSHSYDDEVEDFIINNLHQPSGNDDLAKMEDLVSDYESRSSGTTSFSRNHLLVNYFVRGLVNGAPQALGIDSSIRLPSTLPYTNDIDSVIYLSYIDIPFQNIQWQVYFRPDYTFSIRKDLGINYKYNTDRHYGKGSISTCPNFSFLKHDFINVCIHFPQLRINYHSQGMTPVAGLGGFVVTQDDHELFVEKVLIPSVSSVVSIDAYPIPLNFSHAARFGVGHSALRLSTEKLNLVISEMRRVISNSNDLHCFSGFFFSIINHGEKVLLPPINNRDLTNDAFIRECLYFLPFDWDRIVVNQLYLDLALVIRPPSGVIASGLWKDYDYIRSLFFAVDGSFSFVGAMRKDGMCGFTDLGGFKYSPINVSKGSTGVTSMQCYCLFKHIDFKRSNLSFRQSKDMTVKAIISDSKGVKNWVDKLSEDLTFAISEGKSYGVRVEFRVSASRAKDLFSSISDPIMVRKLSKAIKFYHTKSVLGFVKYRLQASSVLYSHYHDSLAKSSYSGLTLAAVISYLFGTLLHRPLDSRGMKLVHELIFQSKLVGSRCVFLHDFFVDEYKNWGVISPLCKDDLVQVFGSADVIACAPSSLVNDPLFVPVSSTQVDTSTGLNTEHIWVPSSTDTVLMDLIPVLSRLQISNSYPHHDLLFTLTEDLLPGYMSSLQESLNFQLAANIIMVFGMGDRSVSLMAQLLMADLINGFNSWEIKTKDEFSFGSNKKVCAVYMASKVGDLIFKEGGPDEYIKPEFINIASQGSNKVKDAVKYFIPKIEVILENKLNSYLQKKSSGWKTLGARAYLILLLSHISFTERRQAALYRANIIRYIASHYAYLPKMAKDKVYNIK
ncbi:hypothetical protein ABG067_007638 [Albugo candida]